MEEFDLIVIGAGSGLDVAAAASGRLKVAVIEKGPMGGTCLNRGCIPSKMIIHSADVAETIRNSEAFGVSSSIKRIDFKKVTDRANNMVDADAASIKAAYKPGGNPALFQGECRFVGNKTLEVLGKKIRGKKIVIAAGARPRIPPIEGLDKVPYLTSTEALRLTKLPKRLLIVGGGYIACELGHFYANMGSEITVVQRNALLIPREDKDIAEKVTDIWKKRYKVLTNANATKVEKKGSTIILTVDMNGKKKRLEGDQILIATGVTPNTDILDVEKTGVKVDKKGFIKVNKYMETTAKDIWAFGDIAGIYLFKHTANHEGQYVLNNIFHAKRPVDYTAMPHAIFSSPQVAGVGVTEQEADKKVAIGKYPYEHTGMGSALAEKDGFVKFIIDPKTRKILGCHILGPHASILIHEVLVAMKAGLTIDSLADTVHIHPSLSEVVQRAAYRL